MKRTWNHLYLANSQFGHPSTHDELQSWRKYTIVVGQMKPSFVRQRYFHWHQGVYIGTPKQHFDQTGLNNLYSLQQIGKVFIKMMRTVGHVGPSIHCIHWWTVHTKMHRHCGPFYLKGLLSDTHNYGLRMRRECRECFPRPRLQRKPLVNDLAMHHGTCVTHVPWCMSGSLTRGGGGNVPGIPGACATHNFTYLARGPWRLLQCHMKQISWKLKLSHVLVIMSFCNCSDL